MWLTHHQMAIYVFFAVTATIDNILHSGVVDGVVLAAFVGLVAVNIGLVRHTAVLCETCIAEFPIDGDAQATKRMKYLAYNHNVNHALWKIAFLWGGAIFLGSQYKWLIGLPWVVTCFDVRARTFHRRLEPWCPWCRDEDDGFETVKPPVPSGEASR